MVIAVFKTRPEVTITEKIANGDKIILSNKIANGDEIILSNKNIY